MKIEKRKWTTEYKDIKTQIYNRIKRGAESNGLNFNLSPKFLWDLYEKQNRLCALSGQPISFSTSSKLRYKTTASLDRINSNKGYTEDNVQWVHKWVNLTKNKTSQSEFINWCNLITNHTTKHKSDTIAIWGGCGFIGSVLTQRLLNNGYNVIVFDNLYKNSNGILQHFDNPKFTFYKYDITIESDVIKSYEHQFNKLILLSGIVGVPACNQWKTLATLVNDTGWKYVTQHKPKDCKIVAASTGSVYGAITDGLCTETIKPKPLSHYGITKLIGEQYVVDKGGIALRFATAAGVSPQIRLNLLPNYFAYHAIHDRYLVLFEPDHMRTFIDVRDLSDSLLFFIENFDTCKHQVYNVGDECNNLSKRKLAQYVKSKTGCKLFYSNVDKDQDARNYIVDYTRLHETKFRCKNTIQNTLDNLLKAMKSIQIPNPYE